MQGVSTTVGSYTGERLDYIHSMGRSNVGGEACAVTVATGGTPELVSTGSVRTRRQREVGTVSTGGGSLPPCMQQTQNAFKHRRLSQ